MLMAVVQVGVVRVPVHERFVSVPVGMRLLHQPAGNVRVPGSRLGRRRGEAGAGERQSSGSEGGGGVRP